MWAKPETWVGCSNMILLLQHTKVQQSVFQYLCCQNNGYLTMLYDLQKSAERVFVHSDLQSTEENVVMTCSIWLMEAVKSHTSW
jgi:helix-turn-helix protein